MSSRPLLAVEQTGQGEPLVLIHGLATTRRIWDSVAPALARDLEVVTVDLPGFGESAPAGAGFELDAAADRILRGLSARGIRGPFDLVGHSLGAGVALTLAATHPRAVSKLVLVAPAGFARLPPFGTAVAAAAAQPLLAARRRLAALTDLPWGRRLLLAFAAADGAAIAPTQARLLLDASAGAQRTAAALRTITTTDLRPLLRTVRTPVGVIWGAQDRTVPARLAQVVVAARPDAEVTIVERAGHVVMVERPDAFVAALRDLLDRLDKDATTPPGARITLH